MRKRIRPWVSLPNIRQYYSRLGAEFLRELFRLGWPQAIGIIIAFLILVFQGAFGLIPPKLIWRAFLSIAWPYAVTTAGLAIFVFGRCPVKLDNQRRMRIRLLRASGKARISAKSSELKALELENATLKLPKYPPVLMERVQAYLAEHPEGHGLLERLMVNEEIKDQSLKREPGGNSLISSGILMRREDWIRRGVVQDQDIWSIAKQYRAIVSDLLYGPSNQPNNY